MLFSSFNPMGPPFFEDPCVDASDLDPHRPNAEAWSSKKTHPPRKPIYKYVPNKGNPNNTINNGIHCWAFKRPAATVGAHNGHAGTLDCQAIIYHNCALLKKEVKELPSNHFLDHGHVNFKRNNLRRLPRWLSMYHWATPAMLPAGPKARQWCWAKGHFGWPYIAQISKKITPPSQLWRESLYNLFRKASFRGVFQIVLKKPGRIIFNSIIPA